MFSEVHRKQNYTVLTQPNIAEEQLWKTPYKPHKSKNYIPSHSTMGTENPT